MTIGIFINNVDDMFTSGAIQQAYFTYLVIKNIDDVVLLAHSSNKNTLTLFDDIPVRNINEINEENTNGIDLIIFTSVIPSNVNTVLLLKQLNIKLIYQICGNYFILNQEDYVFNCHKRKFYETTHLIDEIWLLPMYEHMLSYIHSICKVPVKIVPYVWNSDILHKYCNTFFNFDLSTLYYKRRVNRTVAFLEPNVSIHKTSLVPTIITENAFHNNDMFDHIKIMSFDYKNHEGFSYICSKLSIFNRIQFYPRLNTLDILNQLKDRDIDLTCISHQIFNDLNFLHFELLYLGYPLIHNCEHLKSVGFYYNQHNITEGSNQLKHALTNYYHSDAKKNKSFLDLYDPDNVNVINKYSELINYIKQT